VDRWVDREPGIAGAYCFSYGGYYDPDNVSFGPLIAANWFDLEPDAGFDLHEHAGVEIVTWMVHGELTHSDSMGGSAVLRPGWVGRLSTGAGVRHAEFNRGRLPASFVQLWLSPDFGGRPDYEVRDLTQRLGAGDPVAVAGNADPPTSLTIRQDDVVIWAARCPDGRPIRLPDAEYRWVLVLQGGLTVVDAVLGPGDEARLEPGTDEACRAVEGGVEILAMTAGHLHPAQPAGPGPRAGKS